MSVRRICKLHGRFEGTGVTCDTTGETCCVLFRCERMPEGVPFGDVLLFGLQIDWIRRVRCHLIQSGQGLCICGGGADVVLFKVQRQWNGTS